MSVLSVDNAALVSGLAEFKEEAVTDFAWLPALATASTGDTLAIGRLDGVAIYDISTRQKQTFLESSGGIADLAFSPNGSLLVAGNRLGSEDTGFAGIIELWRVENWQRLGPLFGDTLAVSSIAFSPDGETFAASFTGEEFKDDRVEFWNTRTWEITRTLQAGQVLEIAFAPEGGLLASVPDLYATRLWRLEDGLLQDTLFASFTGAVNSLAFSPDGRILATGHYDGQIRFWDTVAGKPLLTIQTQGVVESLAFTPSGTLLASGESYQNHTVRLWAVNSGELLRTLDGHEHAVTSLSFSPGGQLLVSGSYDGTVRLWGLRP
jgi:WD40 repeat protein